MKNILNLLLLALITPMGLAQSPIQIIKIKNKDNTVTLKAKNHTDESFNLMVDIKLDNMESSEQLPITKMLSGKESLELTKLSPTAANSSYFITYNVKSISSADEYYIKEPNVTIYTKNNHGPSTEMRLYLQKNEIPYYEYNINYDEKSKTRFREMLIRRGLKENDITLPVVIINGEIFYSIPNIKSFVNKNSEKLQKLKQYK